MLLDRIATWGEARASPPATVQELLACEVGLGHRLPGELRTLLLEANGIEGEYGLGLVWPASRIGVDNAMFRSNVDFAELYMPFEALVFFSDAGNGDQFAVSLRGSREVYVWNHVDDSRIWVAPTIAGFLEDWMTGRLRI